MTKVYLYTIQYRKLSMRAVSVCLCICDDTVYQQHSPGFCVYIYMPFIVIGMNARVSEERVRVNEIRSRVHEMPKTHTTSSRTHKYMRHQFYKSFCLINFRINLSDCLLFRLNDQVLWLCSFARMRTLGKRRTLLHISISAKREKLNFPSN